MEFLDAQGKVIRTFTGTPADAEREAAGRRRRRRRRVPASAGARIRRSRPGCSGSRGTCGIQARPISRTDHVGRQHTRSAGAARRLSGAA